MNEKKIILYINNLSYTLKTDEELKKEVKKFINIEENLDTKDLVASFMRVTQEYLLLKKEIDEISENLEHINQKTNKN